MMNTGFHKTTVLIPKAGLDKWSVVACDQHTSDPIYWEKVHVAVEHEPSTYHMIFPEIFLGKVDFELKKESILAAMRSYLDASLFSEHKDCLVYVERTLHSGSVRKGLIGVLDLECYDFTKGSGSLVRATEGTVLERLPPRVKIREGAPLETPHILVLIDDEAGTVIEPFHEQMNRLTKLYDVDLMLGGGNVRGYMLTEADYEKVQQKLAALANPDSFNQKYGVHGRPPLLFAMGDGNHSLATAKECYTRLKAKLGDKALDHPARYAMVELINVHDEALQFEPIHRAVFEVVEEHFMNALDAFCKKTHGPYAAQTFTVVTPNKERLFEIPTPASTLAVGSVQTFLEEYTAQFKGRVDYIHGEDVARNLARRGAVSILLTGINKPDLFKTVILEGALPCKTFSMGHADEKRYYLECRRLY